MSSSSGPGSDLFSKVLLQQSPHMLLGETSAMHILLCNLPRLKVHCVIQHLPTRDSTGHLKHTSNASCTRLMAEGDFWAEAAQELLSAWDDAAQAYLDGPDAVDVAPGPLLVAPHRAEVPEPGSDEATPARRISVPNAVIDQSSSLTFEAYAPSPLEGVFQQVLQLPEARLPLADLDPGLEKVVRFFYQQNMSKLHASKVSLSQLLQISADSIEPHLCTVADAMAHSEKHRRRALEAALSSSPVRLVMYLECCRYDETPMRITHKQTLASLGVLPAPSSSDDRSSGGKRSHQELRGGHQIKASSVSKMFSTEQTFACLLEVTLPSEAGPRRQCVGFQGSTLCWNQLLEKTTSQNILAALMETSTTSSFASEFGLKCRISTTDLAGGNIGAEKLYKSLRGAEWSHIHLACNVHIVARMHSKALSFWEADISGALNLSLCLSAGAAMTKFRAALADIVSERLTITRHKPSLEAEKHKAFLLKLFGSTGTKKAERHFLLSSVITGDWRLRDVLQVYIPPGLPVDLPAVQKNVLEAATNAISRSNFHVFPRHRWLGADRALDEIGLCEGVFGLCSAAFARMHAPAGGPVAAGGGLAGGVPHEADAGLPGMFPLTLPWCQPLQRWWRAMQDCRCHNQTRIRWP